MVVAKTCITDSDLGLDFINAIRPVKYKWKTPRDLKKDTNGDLIVGSADSEGVRNSKQFQYGIIAQEVEEVMKKFKMKYEDFAGVNDREKDQGKKVGTLEQAEKEPDKYWYPGEDDYDPEHPDGGYMKLKSAKYIQFIAPMMKAIQELSAKVDALEKA